MMAAGIDSLEMFADKVLNAPPALAAEWRDGTAAMDGTARVACLAIVRRPETAAELMTARAALPLLGDSDIL
jgi:hypothetical protein